MVRSVALTWLLVSMTCAGCDVGASRETEQDCSEDCAVMHARLVRIEVRRLSSGAGIVCICEPESQR